MKSIVSRPRRWAFAAIATFGAVGAVLIPVASASAAYGNVYVSFPTWLGNCPGGGSVVSIYGAVGNSWSTSPYGDVGDDLIYPRVVMYASNQLSAQVICSRPWYNGGNYRGAVVSAAIRPSRGGQTFWVGPFGQRNN